MAQLKFDFADPAVERMFPAHGWSLNSQGVRLLWLPVVRHLYNVNEIRNSKGGSEIILEGDWNDIRRFEETATKLVLATAELRKCMRNYAAGFDAGNLPDSFQASRYIPLWVDLAYVYLRRVADDLARAGRLLLFRNPHSAPREFKKLRPFLADERKVAAAGPLASLPHLRRALDEDSAWFDVLRNTGPRKGLRDRMEHHAVRLQVQGSGTESGPMDVQVFMLPFETGAVNELLKSLRLILEGFCRFCTRICAELEWETSYEQWVIHYGDCAFVPGNDEDATAMWPQIGRIRTAGADERGVTGSVKDNEGPLLPADAAQSVSLPTGATAPGPAG